MSATLLKKGFSLLAVLATVLFIQACTQHSTKIPNVLFHNTTARFNAYYLADLKMQEVETTLRENHKNDFNRVLDVIYNIDTTAAKAYKEKTDYARKNSDIIIKKHGNSHWVDDSYIMAGVANLYDGDFNRAQQFFRYVNTKSKDKNARHQALIRLMQTYMELDEKFNVDAVEDYLVDKDLSNKNLRDFSLVRAQKYLDKYDYKTALKHVEIAIPFIDVRDEKSRAHFIAGQIRQRLGDKKEATKHYRSVLKKNPPYEFAFYSRLNLAQVSDAQSTADVKKIRKYFDKLLKDEKNEEYQDRIYYEMAKYDQKQKLQDPAIVNYNNSVRSSKGNETQKAYAYLELGKIYYDKKEFRKSKEYYDSTVTAFPKDFQRYDEIAERRDILTDFVNQLTIISDNDSLIDVYSNKDSLERELLIDKDIARRKKIIKDSILDAREKVVQAKAAGTVAYRNPNSTFSLFNPQLINRGAAEFRKKWGARELTDHWRRSSRALPSDVADESVDSSIIAGQVVDPLKKDSLIIEIDRAPYYAAALNNPKDFQQAKLKVQNAYYKLGKIYNLQLFEYENSIKTFQTLLEKYPENEHKIEVMYFLYLLCQKSTSCSSEDWKNKIQTEYPNSLYARVIDDPSYITESKKLSIVARGEYEKAYNLYRNNRFYEARLYIDEVMKKYPHNDVKDKLMFVRANTYGHTHGLQDMQTELQKFIKTYRYSDLVPKAKRIILLSEQLVAKASTEVIPDSVEVKYLEDDFYEPHYVVAQFHKKKLTFDELFTNFFNFNKLNYDSENLGITKGQLNDSLSVLKVYEFTNQDSARNYMTEVMGDSAFIKQYAPDKRPQVYLVSKSNYPLLINSGKLNQYLEFYRKKYRQ